MLNHVVHQHGEMLSAWRSIIAPVLSITASDSRSLRFVTGTYGGKPAMRDRMAHFSGLSRADIAEPGHNVQHDQPEALARLIEPFLASGIKRTHSLTAP